MVDFCRGEVYRPAMNRISAILVLFALSGATAVCTGDAASAGSRDAAIVCLLTGQAGILADGATPARPLALFDLLRPGEIILTTDASSVRIAFADGRLFEVGPLTRARVDPKGITRLTGSVREIAVKPKLDLAPILDQTENYRTLAAMRVRNDHGSPRAVIADQAVLAHRVELGGPTYERYRFRIVDHAFREIYSCETAEPSLQVPVGVLKPGTQNCWTLWGILVDREDLLVEDRPLLIIGEDATRLRSALRAGYESSRDISWLLLLAGYDAALGLRDESLRELEEASALSPDNPAISQAVTIARGDG
ncbi:MAG: hypothetical protein AB1714_21440 [Acidobacteriota bacterium]